MPSNAKRKTGPARSCDCGDLINCKTCRRREQTRRSYHGLEPLPKLSTWGGQLRRPRIRLPADDRMLAYIAGIIDGEGSITRANGRPIVQVGMTDEPLIRWLGRIGGTVRTEQPPGNRKLLYRWRLMAGADVRIFLWAIYPYLRVKQQQAEDAIVEIEGRTLDALGEA